MKILHISAHFYPSYRGTELTVANLCDCLVKLGHKVDILTTNERGAKPIELWNGKVRVYRCFSNFRYHRAVLSLELSKKLLQAKDYDLYHIHIPFHGGLEMTVIASKMNNIPIVANHHGEGPRSGPLHGLLNHGYNALYRRTSLHFIKKIIFFTKSYPESLNLSNSIQERIRIIRPAVDVTRFSPSKNGRTLRKRYGFDNDEHVILFVSALDPWSQSRGAFPLIQAIKMIVKKVPETRLVIVGEGGLLPKLKRITHKLSLESYVIFAGKVMGDELALHYAMCDIYVHPSTYESFGFVVLEAMASGKPVIVADIPGVREIVKREKTGLIVPPSDIKALAHAMIFLLRNDELRYQMGMNARKEVESRSWKNVAEEVTEVYREVIENSEVTSRSPISVSLNT